MQTNLLLSIFLLLFVGLCLTVETAHSTEPTRYEAQYTKIYSTDFEGSTSGIKLLNSSCPPSGGCSTITSDPSLVIAGKSSLRLNNNGRVSTDPTVLTLSGNTTYIIEFQYHIINYGPYSDVLHLDFYPDGSTDEQAKIQLSYLHKNSQATGTFSSGALTGNAASYLLYIGSIAQADVVIDNITIYKQDSIQSTVQPAAWSKLSTLPFPRLGKYFLGNANWIAASPPADSTQYSYSIDKIEGRLAFYDLMAGIGMLSQTGAPDSIRRIRNLNPYAVVLPYRLSEEQLTVLPAPSGSNVDFDYQFLQGVLDDWYIKDSKGNYPTELHFPGTRMMNISSYCPVVNGQTFVDYELNWLNGKIFPSGMWDGIFFDNLFGKVDSDLANYNDPELFDMDFNRNGIRDETPAAVNDMIRGGVSGMLRQFRERNGDLQLIMGNSGAVPQLSLAKYVNGYLFECFNYGWNRVSPAGWRTVFDAYRTMQATSQSPHLNLLEGCGSNYAFGGYSPSQSITPTAADILSHRFAFSTALLSDGFYSYDLYGGTTPPMWYDEYSVDSSGTAEESLTKKGYLGQALSDATEITNTGSMILEEMFDGSTLPMSFTAYSSTGGSVYISKTPGEVISGSGSLVLYNQDHTKRGSVNVTTNPNVVKLDPSNNYLLTFDWHIIETLDSTFGAAVYNSDPSKPLDVYMAPGLVAGDSGTTNFPFTISTSGKWTISFYLVNGGGKVAIDNIKIFKGVSGPWRRDFENGFVLVNPYLTPYTFSASELAGTFKRTGIKRILGTQAPDVNNGQYVTGSLTLQPFDAIILLADNIPNPNVACGSSNGTTLSTTPATNLCTFGTASTVNGTGPWTWTCTSADGTNTASCGAYSNIATTTVVDSTKAKVFLGTDDIFTVSNSSETIYGGTGNDTATITAGMSGIILDQNVDRINLPSTLSSYSFKQTGNIINIYNSTGTTLIVKAPVQGDSDGTLLAFSNGMASVKMGTGGVMSLGNSTVSSSTATTLTPTLTASTQATATNTKAKVFLDANDNFTVSTSGTTVYGNSGTEVVTIASGVTNVTLDQNVEQINFPGASSSYTFKQTGNIINVYDLTGTTLIVKAPVQGDSDGTVLSFSDWTASALMASGGVMTLGGNTVSASAANELPPKGGITDYLTKDITSSLSIAGIWQPVSGGNSGSTVNFYGIPRLGSNQLQGVVLAGWSSTGFNSSSASFTPVSIAILSQQSDGTLKLATDQFVSSAVTNGAGSVLIADFNGDGKDDIFLVAHNEAPIIPESSTAYLSKPDSTFTKVTLADSVTAHGANLAYINSKPTVLEAGWNTNLFYTYNGQGGFDINNSAGNVSAESVAAADFIGNGSTQIVYGDVSFGPGIPYTPNNIHQQFIYNFVNGKLVGPPVSLPAPYFNGKPQYTQYVSFLGNSKTENPRVWIDDINHDGKPDIVVLASIWEPTIGLQKTMLQLLVNQGDLKFVDQSDQLNQDYNQDAYDDYSLRMADVDQSGINTYFMAQNSQPTFANGLYTPAKSRHGNYIMVNDGTGRFHSAMHDEFIKMGDYVNQYLANQFKGTSYWIGYNGVAGIADTPRFIAYQTPSGLINFLAVVGISQQVNGQWIFENALVNVPTGINLKTDYKENITITDRNGSHLIRTFAGNDVIYSGNSGGYATIDGGLGFNTVIYSGKRNNYTITKTSTGYIVKDNVGNDGTDTLINIQMLQFSDISVDIS